jgi:hypothetical protein
MKANKLPEINYLKESFIYDESSPSRLIWNTRPREHFNTERGFKIFNSSYLGHTAGHKIKAVCGREHWLVKLNQLKYPVHRIVWAMFNESDPFGFEIDHIDCDATNNTYTNLRIATRQENACNRNSNGSSTCKYKGVCFEQRTGKWYSQITFKGKNYYLGRHTTPELARDAYNSAVERVHGQFARLS